MTTNTPHIHGQEAMRWEGPSMSTSGVLVSSGGTNRLPAVCREQTRSQQVKRTSNVTNDKNVIRNGGAPVNRSEMLQTQPEMDVLTNGERNVTHLQNADLSCSPTTTDERSAKQSLEKLRQMRQRLHSDDDLKPNRYATDRSKHPRTLSDEANFRLTRSQPVDIVNSVHNVRAEGRSMQFRLSDGLASPPATANLREDRFSFERGPLSPSFLNSKQTSLDIDVSSEPTTRSSTPIGMDTPSASASASPVTVSPGSSDGVAEYDDNVGQGVSYRKLWKNRSMRKKAASSQDVKPSQENGSRKVLKRGESSPSFLAGTAIMEKQVRTQDKERHTDRRTHVEQSETHAISEHLDTGSPQFRRSVEGNSTRRSLRLKYPKAMQQIPSFNEFRRMRKDGHVSPSSKFTTTLSGPVEESEDCSSVSENMDDTAPVATETVLEERVKRYSAPGDCRTESGGTVSGERTEVAKSVQRHSLQDLEVSLRERSKEASKGDEKSILSILSTYYAKEGKRSEEVCKEKGLTDQEVLKTRHANKQIQKVDSSKRTRESCTHSKDANTRPTSSTQKLASPSHVGRFSPSCVNGCSQDTTTEGSQQEISENSLLSVNKSVMLCETSRQDNHIRQTEPSFSMKKDLTNVHSRSDAFSNIVQKELSSNCHVQRQCESNSDTLLHNNSVEVVHRIENNTAVPRLDLEFVNEETATEDHSLLPVTEVKTVQKEDSRPIHVIDNGVQLPAKDCQQRYVDASNAFSVSPDTCASNEMRKESSSVKISECNDSAGIRPDRTQERRNSNGTDFEEDLKETSESAFHTRLQKDQMLHKDYFHTAGAVSGTVTQPTCKHVNNKHNPAGPLETRIPSTTSEMSTSCSNESQTSQKSWTEPSDLNRIHRRRTDGRGLEAEHHDSEAERGAIFVASEVHCPEERSSLQELGQDLSATTEPKGSCFEDVERDMVGANSGSPDDNSPHKVGGMSLVTVEWTLRRNKGCLVEAVNSNEDAATPYVSAVDQLKSITRHESSPPKVSPRSWYSRHWSAPISPRPMLETNLAVTTSVASNDSSPASTPRARRKQLFPAVDICTAVSAKLQGTESTKGATEVVQEGSFASDNKKDDPSLEESSHSLVGSQANLCHDTVETKTASESLTQQENCHGPASEERTPSKIEKQTERKDDTISQTNSNKTETVVESKNTVGSHTGTVIKEMDRTDEDKGNSDEVKSKSSKGNKDAEGLSIWGSITDEDVGSRDICRRGSAQSSQSNSSGDDTEISMPEIQLVFQDSPVHVSKVSSENTDQDCVFDLAAFVEQEQGGTKTGRDENDLEGAFLEAGDRMPLSKENRHVDDKERRKRQGMSWNTEKEEWINLERYCNDRDATKDANGDKQSLPTGRSNSYRKRGLERQKPVSSTSEVLLARKYKSERKKRTGASTPTEKGNAPKRSVTWHALVRTSEVKTESKPKPQSSVARSTSDVTNSSSSDHKQDKTPRPVRQHHSDPSSMAMHRTRNWLHRHHGMEDLTIVEGVPSDPSDKKASRTKSKNRHSNVSTASVDSGVIALGEEKSIMERRPSAVDIARNDSGVGMETTRVPRKTRETTDESNCADCERVNTVIDVEEEEESPRSYRTEEIALCPRCEKRRVERKETIQELVQTELSYGADLRVIKEEFYEPIEKAGLLTPQQLQTIFINILELMEVNDRFADKLQDAIEHAQEQGDEDYISLNIGQVFLEAANMLLAFETYCTKQPAAPAMLKTLESEKDLFRIFLEVSQTDNSALRRMHLSSFLMAPLQRITKYPLLLSRLYKSTSCRHPDRDRLSEAQQLVEEHLEHINIKTQGSGGLMRLRKKSSKTKSTSSVENIELREMALDAVSWNKDEVHFIHMGKLQVVQCGDTWAKKTKVSSVHALLLVLGQMPNIQALEENRQPTPDKTVKGAALVLIRDKGAGRFTPLRDPFFLDKCVVSTDLDSEETFEITEIQKDPYLLKGEDPTDTSRWLALLRSLSRSLGNWRKRRNALANIMIHMVSRT